MKKKIVLHSLISVGTCQEYINGIFLLIERKIPSYVCFANAETVVKGHKEIVFQKILNKANIVIPHGKSISRFLKYFTNLQQTGICEQDLLPEILKVAELTRKSVFIYGLPNDILNDICENVKLKFPNINISGSAQSKTISNEVDIDSINEIKKVLPDLVFVALSFPKQEKWMASNKDKIGTCLIGIGDAFKRYYYKKNQTQKWNHYLSLIEIFKIYLKKQAQWESRVSANTSFMYLAFNYLIGDLMHRLSTSLTRYEQPETIWQDPED